MDISVLDLPIGQIAFAACVERAGAPSFLCRRLRELGLDEGVDVELLHRAPRGGPLLLRIGGVRVAMRLNEARHVHVRRAA